MISFLHQAIAVARTGAAILLAIAAGHNLAQAQSPKQDENFTENRSFNIYVGAPAGGSYDAYARLLSRHIARHLPGEPAAVLVRNMPGGAGLTAASYLYNVAPKDGLHIATFESGAPFAAILAETAAQLDGAKFTWLGNFNTLVPLVIARRDSDVATTDDLFRKQLLVGATGAGSSTAVYPSVLNRVLGTKMRVVTGYSGAADILLAIERGELQGYAGWCWDCMKRERPQWIANGPVRILMQIATEGDPELNKAGVPTAGDFAKSPAEKATLRLALAGAILARPYAAPPGLAGNRAQALKTAFAHTAIDPEFLGDAGKLHLPIIFKDAATVSAQVMEILATDPAIVAELKAARNAPIASDAKRAK